MTSPETKIPSRTRIANMKSLDSVVKIKMSFENLFGEVTARTPFKLYEESLELIFLENSCDRDYSGSKFCSDFTEIDLEPQRQS